MRTKRFWALADNGNLVSGASDKKDPDDFGSAVRILARLYKRCERTGNRNLARRAQAALAALLGPQKHLQCEDSPMPAEPLNERTLRGLGP